MNIDAKWARESLSIPSRNLWLQWEINFQSIQIAGPYLSINPPKNPLATLISLIDTFAKLFVDNYTHKFISNKIILLLISTVDIDYMTYNL